MSDADFNKLSPHLQNIRVPSPSDKIYKDECVYSFDNPDLETGLYVCLKTFLGLGKDYLERHFKKTGSAVYLHIKRDQIEKKEIQGDGPERKVTKLAIGIEGGFEPDKKDVITNETYAIFILPDLLTIPWPSDGFPKIINDSVEGVLAADSATKKAELEAVSGTWDGEVRFVTKHADNLVQLDNGVKVPPSGWQCDECDLTSNLWLNLTDGKILCGRKFFDGTGGNEHALQYYKKTGYPLAVKLGTITKEGKGDVYSYDEDDMVEDPNLIQHLAHFGINIQNVEKTEKSMAELELALNTSYKEWSGAEDGVSITGPGLTGLANMGNSCYLNSVVQLLFLIPDFVKKYYENADKIFDNAPSDPATDFNVQMAKLAVGVLSGKYARTESEGPEKKIIPPVTPLMFKILVGKGHPDFSSKHQQDAHEFFLHLLSLVSRSSRGGPDPTDSFKLQVEDRFECGSTGKAKYTTRTEYCLPLGIPLPPEQLNAFKSLSPSLSSSKDYVRPAVDFSACLSAFLQAEIVDQFYSTAIQGKTTAKKTTRLATFPDFLLIHLKKFCLNENWQPVKLDVSVDMPTELDLKPLGRHQRPPGEGLLPESHPGSLPPPPVLDQEVINALLEQGFPLDACKRAAYFTKGQGAETAANWLMEHIGDHDISDPFVVPGAEPPVKEFIPDEEGLMMLTSMGFTRAQATKALKATDNNVERAGDWIFSHAEELDQEDDEPKPKQRVAGETYRDGNSTYKLVGFITHIGPSSMIGHYVCHLLKDGRWVLFNDEKVAYTETLPKNLGYLYLYQRI